MVTDLVSGVTAKQAAAAESVNGLISGKNVSLHQTMIAMEEASISFQLMVEVRNKMLEAYQELMRMQV
jgi:flagellar hook-basal body complex protein FliE